MRLERAVETAEATLAALEDELADPKAWATKYESGKSTARHTAAKRAVEDAYADARGVRGVGPGVADPSASGLTFRRARASYP